MTISGELETIFAQAVGLNQSGRMSNTIHLGGRKVYILNTDKTLLLRFDLPQGITAIAGDYSFNANDYDSNIISVEGSTVSFLRNTAEWTREKIVRGADQTFDEVNAMFERYFNMVRAGAVPVTLRANILELIDENLSHIEFHLKEGPLTILQRDIFSGALIKLEKPPTGLLSGVGASGPSNIETMGLRTNDFMSLFGFQTEVKLIFAEGQPFCTLSGDRWGMKGIIGTCLYDELGTLSYLKED